MVKESNLQYLKHPTIPTFTLHPFYLPFSIISANIFDWAFFSNFSHIWIQTIHINVTKSSGKEYKLWGGPLAWLICSPCLWIRLSYFYLIPKQKIDWVKFPFFSISVLQDAKWKQQLFGPLNFFWPVDSAVFDRMCVHDVLHELSCSAFVLVTTIWSYFNAKIIYM